MVSRDYLIRSRHNSIYYFRRRLPQSLKELVRSGFAVKSLGTSDRKTALVRARLLAVATDTLFARWSALSKKSPDLFKAELKLALDLNFGDSPHRLEIEFEPHEQDAAHAAIAKTIEQLKSASDTRTAPASQPEAPELLLPKAIDDFIVGKGIKPNSVTAYRSRLARLTAHFGPHADALAIDQRSFSAFCEALTSAAKSAPRTLEGVITTSAGMLNWHRTRHGLSQLTAKTLLPRIDEHDSEAREAFSLEQLTAVFTAVAKSRTTDPHAYWVTVATALLACRLEELAQIELSRDLIHDAQNDIWYLSINQQPDSDGIKRKSLKNKVSARRLPIHPALVKAGFIEFLKTEAAQGATRPFERRWEPHTDQTEDGQTAFKWSHKISKWGGAQIRKLTAEGVLSAPHRLAYFHSMRHAAMTEMMLNDISSELRSAIGGQSTEGINASTYTKTREQHEKLFAALVTGLPRFAAALEAAITLHP